ncbi:MAG TPA: histidinol-phosphatase [Acidimicrobiales bacterium]|nr:histidinol-phosphatase [Acidimicrobiales bacterium]
MLDYHLHLWPHEESSVWFRLDQIADYCERARANGVSELALTEHTHRFADVRAVVGDFWAREAHEPTSAAMAEYFDFHARNSLEAYVTLAQRAKDEGLPVKIGLEVDYYRGQMSEVAALLAQYPFDVLIGSVHWLGTWQFDDYENPVHLHEWSVRDVEESWRRYAEALDELCATRSVDVLAHPDLIKVAGYRTTAPEPLWDAMAESAAAVDVSLECSSAGWKKPVGEPYPAAGFLDRLVDRGLTFTTASDAHGLERVGERAGDLAAMLEARGVTHLASYRARQRVMVDLRA